jgi:hypothetical protein
MLRATYNKYMSVYVECRNRVMEMSLGAGDLLCPHLKSVQVNNIHAIVFVRCLSSRAILSALVNAALQVEHHFILIERESLLFLDQGKHILAQSELDGETMTTGEPRHTGGLREKSE